MNLSVARIVEEPITSISELSAISIGFLVTSILEVHLEERGISGIRLREERTLGGLNRFAYPEFPHEPKLLWYKELA